MLVIKKHLGYERLYNTVTKKFITVKFTGKDEDVYGNRILEDDGKVLQADLRKNEKIFIISLSSSQKAIALIIGKNKLNTKYMSINDYLKNPENHVYLYSLDGEYIVDIQGYKNHDLTSFSLDNLLSVDFIVAPGLETLTIKRTITKIDENKQQYIEECFYNFPCNRNEKDKDEILDVCR